MDQYIQVLDKVLEAAGFDKSNVDTIQADLTSLAKTMVLERLISDLSEEDRQKVKAALREKERADQVKQLTSSLKEFYPPAEVKAQLAKAFQNLLEEYTENILHKVNEAKKKKIKAIIQEEESLELLRSSVESI